MCMFSLQEIDSNSPPLPRPPQGVFGSAHNSVQLQGLLL
jgi:hypothetical protein